MSETKVFEIDAELNIEEKVIDADLQIEGSVGGTRDYLKLINKPKINGTELVENYNEIDPTVPEWAKEEKKPTYSADEVGAINVNDELSLTSIKEIWDSIFKKRR